jgi:DNA polymerase-3 subunit alpha
MPDFDVDFCQDRRDEVIDYVRRKYGDDRVAHIITFGKLQARMVLRDVGRVLQMPYSQVDRICNFIPNNPANPTTLEQALALEPALEEARRSDASVDKLINIGLKLEGLYRHASTHAAGVVIGDRPLPELVALYKDDRSALPATQFSMKYVEMAGLVKFDFLGLKTLTVIQKCCDMLLKNRGITLDISQIPLDDPKTFELLCRVETVGIFQVESAGMRDIMKKLRPDQFEDLVALVALYRPGPMDDIPRYIACKNGEEEVTYLHPDLKPILEGTYGVMVYQEQVMQIAQVLGGYTLGSADLLRRAMGKKIKSEMDAQQALFVEGAVQRGIKEEIAIQIFEQMAKFAGYGFNKSHSAPYALLTYQTAYLKANFPLEFFAASMTYDIQNTDKLNVFIQDLKKLGYVLYPPDINTSGPYFQVESDGIRYALAAVKNVGDQGMLAIVSEREKRGPFKTIMDFANRLDPKAINKRQLEVLIAAGSFDSIYPKRGELYLNAEEILRTAAIQNQEQSSIQKSLFSLKGPIQEPINIAKVPDWNPLEKLQKEFEALGFFLSAHPLDIYGNSLEKLRIISSKVLPLQQHGTTLRLAGVLIVKQERTSKQGQKFAFLQLSDAHGIYEVAVFSEVFTKVRDFLIAGTTLFIVASIRFNEDDYRLTAQSVDLLDQITENLSSTAHIIVDDRLDVPLFTSTLKSHTGGTTHLTVQVCLASSQLKIGISGLGAYTLNSEMRSRILGVPGVRGIEE